VVARPGVLRHLEALNRGLAVPGLREFSGAPRFAGGGLVVAPGAAASSAAEGGRFDIMIGLSEDLVAREIAKSAGTRAVLRVLQENPRAVKSAR
jgi:hypothetical protein